MALPVSGTIALSQVNTELGAASTANISLNQSNVRTLFGKASGVISLNDGHGKSNAVYSTLNASDKSASVALSNGNLTATFTGTGSVRGTVLALANAGVWRYYESTISGPSSVSIGMGKAAANLANYVGSDSNSDGIRTDGIVNVWPSFTNFQNTAFSSGAVIGWAFSGGGVRVYVNGAYQGGMSCEAADFYPMINVYSYSGSTSITCNFGASAFVYTGHGMGGWTA